MPKYIPRLAFEERLQSLNNENDKTLAQVIKYILIIIKVVIIIIIIIIIIISSRIVIILIIIVMNILCYAV